MLKRFCVVAISTAQLLNSDDPAMMHLSGTPAAATCATVPGATDSDVAAAPGTELGSGGTACPALPLSPSTTTGCAALSPGAPGASVGSAAVDGSGSDAAAFGDAAGATELSGSAGRSGGTASAAGAVSAAGTGPLSTAAREKAGAGTGAKIANVAAVGGVEAAVTAGGSGCAAQQAYNAFHCKRKVYC